MDGSRFSDEDLVFFASKLGTSETDRYRRFARTERQRQFLLGRMLLRFAISDLMALPASAIAVKEQPGEAPQLILPHSNNALPAFSLSHSGKWVACAASRDTLLGLDIEVINPQRDLIGISRSIFRPDELAWLEQHSPELQVAAFYHLWSLREALFKLLSNAGIADRFPELLNAEQKIACDGNGWHSHEFSHPEISCVLCSAHGLSWPRNRMPCEISPEALLAAIATARADNESAR